MEREPIYTCGGNAAYSNGGLRIRIMEPDAGDTTCTFRVSISTASLHGECTAADLRAIAAQCLEAANELDPQP